MSSQKGNVNRIRPQKHQNSKAFKNDLYDNTNTTKFLNSLEISDVCQRCKDILEWKIKYKKYKLLKNPTSCTKCNNKTVNLSYRKICSKCATNLSVCPKCGLNVNAEPLINIE
uniref:Uncharacterized protein n=1 Tax=Panstrongylus lignarius TaxID=156445 RepID=A0A224Y1S8_9HEMI